MTQFESYITLNSKYYKKPLSLIDILGNIFLYLFQDIKLNFSKIVNITKDKLFHNTKTPVLFLALPCTSPCSYTTAPITTLLPLSSSSTSPPPTKLIRAELILDSVSVPVNNRVSVITTADLMRNLRQSSTSPRIEEEGSSANEEQSGKRCGTKANWTLLVRES